MAETLFPKRQRCKACRGSLGKTVNDPVLFGLYCSPKCAGIANPATRPEDAPRECTTVRDGKKAFKRVYRSEGEIPDRLREDPSTSWYTCAAGHIHIGHTRMGTPETFRMLGSPEDLADFLVKRRGKATHAQVAKAAGVQPIRLKELENPKKGQRVDVHVLFAVMAVLGSRPGVAMKELRA
ncbi:hypothetical protein ACF08M_30200 [Streptomyces sp. NPDC015032]|uniref:hypothetical protein n=1 Tax=Streptomyces sp. NPDC015032 TaxID=3364937 RepID=UPI0036FA60E1